MPISLLRREVDFSQWSRPRWVSEERWANQNDLERIIPVDRAIKLRRKAVKIVVKAFEDEQFEDLMRLVFPGKKDRNLYYVAIWSIRDGLFPGEIARRLRGRKGGISRYHVKKAIARIKEYLDLHWMNGHFFRPEEPDLDPDEELEMEIREVIRG